MPCGAKRASADNALRASDLHSIPGPLHNEKARSLSFNFGSAISVEILEHPILVFEASGFERKRSIMQRMRNNLCEEVMGREAL